MTDKAVRRAEALERNEAWASLSPKKQLASLDARGMVAAKQRAKIKARMEESNENV